MKTPDSFVGESAPPKSQGFDSPVNQGSTIRLTLEHRQGRSRVEPERSVDRSDHARVGQLLAELQEKVVDDLSARREVVRPPRNLGSPEPNTISERAVVLDVCWPEVSDDARSERRLSPPVMKPEYATSKGSARLP